ncbi:MAG: M20/M25/M40 family metallo-hydrolase, partial [Hungatella sp.]
AYMQRAADYLNHKYGADTFELILSDSYYNMKEKIEPHIYLVDIARQAMLDLGITPKVCPIRGGTDGARLSYMGLPCPNLCTGGHNFHGKYEFISIQSMEKIVELLLNIIKKFEMSQP